MSTIKESEQQKKLSGVNTPFGSQQVLSKAGASLETIEVRQSGGDVTGSLKEPIEEENEASDAYKE